MRPAAAKPAPWAAMPVSARPAVAVPDSPLRTAHAAGGITLGVEEEFMLLDLSAGTAVLVGPDLARCSTRSPGSGRSQGPDRPAGASCEVP